MLNRKPFVTPRRAKAPAKVTGAKAVAVKVTGVKAVGAKKRKQGRLVTHACDVDSHLLVFF